MHKRPPGI